MTVREQIEVAVDPELDTAPSEGDHLACCRADWVTAPCGADLSNAPVALVFDYICEKCLEIVFRNYRKFGVIDPLEERICFMDGDRCPPDSVVEQRVIDRVRRS